MRLRILEVGLLIGLLVGACSSGTTTTTTTSTTTSTTTTTVATTTTSTLPPGTPGDPEVLAATQASILRLLESEYPDIPAEDYPFPNTITPDPVEAVREMWEFEAWQAQNAPFSWFRELLFVPGSRADVTYGEAMAQHALFGERLEFDDSRGFQWESGSAISLEETSIPQERLDPDLDGSLAVRFTYSQSSGRWVRGDSGMVVKVEPAVNSRTIEVVVTPTDLGWLMSMVWKP